jgi:membrane dipeptidase
VREALKQNPDAKRADLIAERERATGPRPQATLDQVADMIEALANKIGPNRVGIGSDFFASPTVPVGLEDVSRFPHLLAELVMRGWSDSALAGVAGRNFVRVFRAVEQEGERLRQKARPAVGTVKDFDTA